ncbi:MAG: hypothetical protein JXX14_18570 [Deltaproteobacteria bacterium]|nr:hypothetical protein [Deltaproteobacteria bacterium]
MQVQTVGLLFLGSMLIVALFILIRATFFVVKRQTIAIVERFGQFVRTVPSGLHAKYPFMERIAGIVNVRIQHSNVAVETKTEDDIPIRIAISVHYHVLPEKAYDAFYSLDEVHGKISSCLSGIVCIMVPKMKLNAVFKEKANFSILLQNELRQVMAGFGYGILLPSVTGIKPGTRIAMSSDDTDSAHRLQLMAENQSETNLNEEAIGALKSAALHVGATGGQYGLRRRSEHKVTKTAGRNKALIDMAKEIRHE